MQRERAAASGGAAPDDASDGFMGSAQALTTSFCDRCVDVLFYVSWPLLLSPSIGRFRLDPFHSCKVPQLYSKLCIIRSLHSLDHVYQAAVSAADGSCEEIRLQHSSPPSYTRPARCGSFATHYCEFKLRCSIWGWVGGRCGGPAPPTASTPAAATGVRRRRAEAAVEAGYQGSHVLSGHRPCTGELCG